MASAACFAKSMPGFHASPVGFVARLPLTAARFARENFQITRRVEAFERAFAADRDRLRAIDLRLHCSPTQTGGLGGFLLLVSLETLRQ